LLKKAPIEGNLKKGIEYLTTKGVIALFQNPAAGDPVTDSQKASMESTGGIAAAEAGGLVEKKAVPPAPPQAPVETSVPSIGTETFSVGFLSNFLADYRFLAGVALVDIDFRSQFDPILQARGFVPANPIENLHPLLQQGVRPITGDDAANPLVGIRQVLKFMDGMQSPVQLPQTSCIIGPQSSYVGETTALISSSHSAVHLTDLKRDFDFCHCLHPHSIFSLDQH